MDSKGDWGAELKRESVMLPTLEKLSKLWFFVHCFCVCGQPKPEIQIKGFGREEEGRRSVLRKHI